MTPWTHATRWLSTTISHLRGSQVARSRPRLRPAIEPLEGRALLTVMPGLEFQVNPVSQGEQSGALVAANTEGGFIVVWEAVGQPGAAEGAYAQRFTAAGAPEGPMISLPFAPDDVALTENNRFVITLATTAQQFFADGTPQGDPVNVDPTPVPGSSPGESRVAMDIHGNFVVTWASYNSPDHTSADADIFAQQVNHLGALSGARRQVNTTTDDRHVLPDVAIL